MSRSISPPPLGARQQSRSPSPEPSPLALERFDTAQTTVSSVSEDDGAPAEELRQPAAGNALQTLDRYETPPDSYDQVVARRRLQEGRGRHGRGDEEFGVDADGDGDRLQDSQALRRVSSDTPEEGSASSHGSGASEAGRPSLVTMAASRLFGLAWGGVGLALQGVAAVGTGVLALQPAQVLQEAALGAAELAGRSYDAGRAALSRTAETKVGPVESV